MNDFLININYDDIKISSFEIEKYLLENDLNEEEKKYLLIQSIKNSNLFIFEALNIQNEHFYYEEILNNLYLRKNRIELKINKTFFNDEKEEILDNFNKSFINFNHNKNELNFIYLKHFFLKILFFDELIDKVQLEEFINL